MFVCPSARPRPGLCVIVIAVLATQPLAFTAAAGQVDAQRVTHLVEELRQLSPNVHRHDAQRLAAEAHSAARHLAREYRAVRSPHFHNFLVNAGVKKRGLCHHWARDLGEQLAQLNLRTLVLRWGIARGGTLREHNAVVVTARGQPFERGVVLDAWRHSGRLFFTAVADDRYPWKEDPSESFARKPAR